MKKKISIIIVTLCACVGFASAHNRKAVRINEVMVENNNSIVDEYGTRSSWIELFNSNFSPIQISTMYISNDRTNKDAPREKQNKATMYPIPMGDVNTVIEKRQHVIFYADSMPNNGTFHTNFVLNPNKENWIGLFDTDGSLIDEVTIPATLKADETYARTEDGSGEWEVRNGKEAGKYITPSGANIIKEGNHKVEDFAKNDPTGVSMAIMAMAVVFTALLVLCLAFLVIGKASARILRSNKAKAQGVDIKSVAEKGNKAGYNDSGEEIAAIALALHQHLHSHDDESTILTIKKLRRAYSPWNSKIYGLRELPRR